MLIGYGWCVLRAMTPEAIDAQEPDEHRGDALANATDERLWRDFRAWMHEHRSSWLRWQLSEVLNNDRGVLTFQVSRNHDAPEAWDMLAWIAEHGPGSYGLLYVHDDEDNGSHRRATGVDRSNVFRVHRLVHGVLTELDDPFFGPLQPTLER